MDVSSQLDQWVLVLNAVKQIDKTPEQFKLKQDFSKTLVDELLQQAAEHFHLDSAAIYFMCWGRILEKQNSLESYGIKNGTLMILREKNIPVDDGDDSKNSIIKSEADNNSDNNEPSAMSLETAYRYRKALKYLNKHSFSYPRYLRIDERARDRFMKGFPELSRDPTLFGVFTEISTVSTFLDAKFLHETLKRYPSFLAVTEQYIELWKDEISKNPSVNSDVNNLFLLSDDDDESDTQDGQNSRSQQNRSDMQNMARHLSTMIQQRNIRRIAQQQPQSSGGQHITSEMLQNALQSSMPNPSSECAPLSQQSGEQSDSRTPSTSSSSSLSRAPTTLAEQLSRANSQPQTPTSTHPPERSEHVQTLIDRLPQLQAMRELGITDEIVAIQALEAANGDLEVAINIIFSEDN